MKTYAAIAGPSSSKYRVLNSISYPHVLSSFAFDRSARIFDHLTYDGLNGMLDSGAHSAWSRGEVIDLDAYIAWACAYAERYPRLRVTNLDVIPGEKGRLYPTVKERDRAVRESAENAERIRAAGLRVIEVMHLADPLEAFDAMLERRKPGEVVGIGGLAEQVKHGSVLGMFGDTVFDRLRVLNGGWRSLPPIHGFGVSITNILYRYPLASIDASSWVAPQKYGQVWARNKLRVPHGKKGVLARDRLRKAELNEYEMARVLDAWSAREVQLQRFWEQKGVTIEEEGLAHVGH